MNSLELLQELWKRGVQLESGDGELRYTAPKGAITPEIVTELKKHKASIVSLLDQNGSAGNGARKAAKVRPSKNFGIGIERPKTSPLVPEDWNHAHPYFRYVEHYKGFLLSRLGLDKRFVRGEGVWLWDDEGSRILDGIAQYGALPFGFNPPEIWNALDNAHQRMEPSLAGNSRLDAAGALAEKLVGLWPEAKLENVVFANSGTEAVEAAVKLCRAATGRQRLLATRGAFHGLTLGALSATGSPLYHEGFGPATSDVDHIPYGDFEALEKALLSGRQRYAALLLEPIQGESGIVEAPPGYLTRARELCDKTGTLLILDEVQTGLGRTGDMFASQAENVVPDIMPLAKALGGGLLPVGATLYSAKVRTAHFGLRHSSTFAANTLACRVALAALEYLERDGRALIRGVRENGGYLKAKLEELQQRYPSLVAGISGRGYMLGVRLDLSNLWKFPGLIGFMGGQNLAIHLIVSYLLNTEGVRLSPSFSSGGVLRLEPPLIATREHCEFLVTALDRAFGLIDQGDAPRLLAHLFGGIKRQPSKPVPQSGVRRPSPQKKELEPHVSRFAFTVHLISTGDLTDLDPMLNQFEPRQLDDLKNRMAEYTDPVPVGVIELKSRAGACAYGELILVPYTAAELMQMDPEKAHNEVRLAVQIAQERGAQVVGLGGFTSIVTQGGLALDAQGLPPLTSGNAYTSVAAKNAVVRACEERGLPLETASLAIVGAAGMIGRGTALLLADRVKTITLLGNARYPERTRVRLREVGVAVLQRIEELRRRGHKFKEGSLGARLTSADLDQAEQNGDIVIAHNADVALPQADVLVTATSSVRAFIGARHLKQNAIVCDVARPFNVDPDVVHSRPDVALIEGGLIRVGGQMEAGIHAGPNAESVFACVAETMLWALEKAYDRVKPDSAMTIETMEELERYGIRHGFEIAR